MKIQHLLLTICLCCFTLPNFAQKKLSFRFATRAEAQMLITDIDNFTNKLNQFDINARLQKQDGKKSEFLRLAMNETLNWGDQDKARITKSFKSILAKITKQKLKIDYPMEIVLVKTTMNEESGAGAYTRKNWIAIGEKALKESTDENWNICSLMNCFIFSQEATRSSSRKLIRQLDLQLQIKNCFSL